MGPASASLSDGEPWPRAILHVDMDAFFASVEQLDFPELRGRPVIVGGTVEGRGVVSASSYEARVFGVHSAMPMATAVRLCPDGAFQPGRMERYAELSGIIQTLFARFTPLVEPLSVDEAFLDATGSQRLFGPAPAIAFRIKETVRAETGLTASVGVAPTKFVAKIASDLEKPDGLVVIPEAEVLSRLGPLPIEKLWGVGKRAAEGLHRLGIRTIGDLRERSREEMIRRLGARGGAHLSDLAHGLDPREVETGSEVKSVSHETTFARDVSDRGELESTLRLLADKVATRLRRQTLLGRVVQIKVRYGDFSTITRRITLENPTSLAETMVEQGIVLLRERTQAGHLPVRLIGIGMAGLVSEDRGVQTSLFDDGEEKVRAETLERTADAIRERLGPEAIGRAVHLPQPPSASDDEREE